MLLPNAESAVVELAKLRDYSLNLYHERGQHKARVFEAALGVRAEDAEWLQAQILMRVVLDEAEENAPSVFGRRFIVDLQLIRAGKSAVVRTTWIIEYGVEHPWLASWVDLLLRDLKEWLLWTTLNHLIWWLYCKICLSSACNAAMSEPCWKPLLTINTIRRAG